MLYILGIRQDLALQALIQNIYEAQGVVAAVCHGPAALVNVRLANGDYLLQGKRVNGFTNKEEQAFDSKWQSGFAFLLQDKLIERGALFESSPLMLNHVTVDGRLITGQNPTSTANTAEAVVRALGLTPVARTDGKADRSLLLIAELLEDSTAAITRLRQQPQQFALNYIATWGYLQMQHAANSQELAQGVKITEIAREFFQHPKIDLALAEAWLKQQQTAKARTLLTELLAHDNVREQARTLLDTI